MWRERKDAYLDQRLPHKKVCQSQSQQRHKQLRGGGGVLSPILFLVYISDLPQLFSPYIHRALHAYYLAIWTAAETIGTAQTRMQDAISKVEKWAKDWGVTINESKTASMLFSLSTKPGQFRLKVKLMATTYQHLQQ